MSVTSAEGREYYPGYKTSGWTLGTSTAISGQPHPASFIAQTSARLLAISAGDFLRRLQQDQILSLYVCDLHSREQCELLNKLSSLALYSARQRLEEFLWSVLPSLNGVNGKVQLPFTDSEITRFISSTRQHVSSLFGQLEAEGLIHRSAWLVVPNPDRLWHRDGVR